MSYTINGRVQSLLNALDSTSILVYGIPINLAEILFSVSVTGKTQKGFVVYLNIPTWPTGSKNTTAKYCATLRNVIGKAYLVGQGILFISILYQPPS